MKLRLTKRSVESVKPSAQDIIVWDSDLKGLGCKVTPKGRRVYFVYYRTRDGQQRRPKIGDHGVVTCEQARETARQWLAEASAGGDPSAKRKARREAQTISALCDRFIVEHCSRRRNTTAKEYRRLIERRIRPMLGKLKVEAVTGADVARLHHSMRDTPRSANQAVSVLSKMINLALRWGLRTDGINPCRGAVDKYPEVKRTRFVTEAEYARLGAALAEAERESTEHPTLVSFFRLVALSGCRLSEIATLRWEYIDLERAIIHLPKTKTGQKVVEVTAPIAAILETLSETSEWVLPALTDASMPLSVHTIEGAWLRLKSRSGLDMRIHDLRHGFGATGILAGVNVRVLQSLLGHATIGMTQRYAAVSDSPRRDAAEAIAGRISGAMNGDTGEVVELRGTKR